MNNFNKFLKTLQKYNSKQEREALLADTIEEIYYILLENTKNKYPDVNYSEFVDKAEIVLFKLGEISVGDVQERMITCPFCEYQDIKQIDTAACFASKDTFKGEFPFGFLDMNSFDDILNELTIKEYENLENEIKYHNNKMFSPSVSLVCKKCNSNLKINLEYEQIISKSSLKNIYKEYLELTIHTNNTFDSLDNLFPFEREFYLKLLEEKIKDKNGIG